MLADCAEASIIGRNTGVYVGGLPDDYIIQRVDTEERAQVLKLYKHDALISIRCTIFLYWFGRSW